MTKFETYTGKNNELYFRLINDEGRVLLSSDGYEKKDKLMSGIESVKKNISIPSNIEMKTSEDGKHFFNLKATDGHVIGKSALWDSADLRETWMKKIKTEVPQAPVTELAK